MDNQCLHYDAVYSAVPCPQDANYMVQVQSSQFCGPSVQTSPAIVLLGNERVFVHHRCSPVFFHGAPLSIQGLQLRILMTPGDVLALEGRAV